MINSIELFNWKTHGRSIFTFSKGTNILIGQMGAGKSSVMDAISFALFGTFPAIKARRVSTEGLIKNRPREERVSTVRLTFTAENQRYVVERSISKDGSSKARLEKDGAYVQSQPQRVNEEIEKALKVDYDLFSRAIYSEQNNLDYFLQLRSSERKRQIDTLLGLDRFAAAQENTTALINKVRELADEEEKLVKSFDLAGVESQLISLEKKAQELDKEGSTLKVLLEQKHTEQAKLEEKLKGIKAEYARKLALEKELDAARLRDKMLEEELAKSGKERIRSPRELRELVEETEKRLVQLRASGSENRRRLQEAQSQRGKAEERLAQIVKKLGEREALTKKLSGRKSNETDGLVKEEEEKLEALVRGMAALASEREEALKGLAELDKSAGRCPICEQILSEAAKKRLIEERKVRLKDLEKRSSAVSAERSEAYGKLTKLKSELNAIVIAENQMAQYEGIEGERSASEKRLEEAARVCTELGTAAEEAEKSVEDATDMLSALKRERETAERIEAYRKERLKLTPLIEERERQCGLIGVDEAAIDEVQSSFTSISTEAGRLSEMLSSNSKGIAEKRKDIKEKKAEVGKLRAISESVRSRRGVAENLARFRNALQEAQIGLRARLIDSINTAMQEAWPDLYPYADYTGITLDVTENDYMLKLKTRSESGERWEDVESIASGGERSIACMCMRIAFSLVLVPNLRWLILDEPTHNIDQQGIGKLVRIFGSTISNYAEQVFIITHDEQLKDVVGSKIYLLSRNKDENGESVVAEQ